MIYNISAEIEEYFLEQYNKCHIRVVPGHWPKMSSKKDVDSFIKNLYMMQEVFNNIAFSDKHGSDKPDKDEI